MSADINSISQANITSTTPEKCPACLGARVQVSPMDGLKHLCPACDGTGDYTQPKTNPIWIWPPYLYPQVVPHGPIWISPQITCGDTNSSISCKGAIAGGQSAAGGMIS